MIIGIDGKELQSGSEALRQYTRGRKISALARAAGVHHNTIRSNIKGHDPQAVTLARVLDALGYDLVIIERSSQQSSTEERGE